MKSAIKVLVLAALFIGSQVNTAKAGELKLLSTSEFQEIVNSDKVEQVDLSGYEITNEELISLHEIKIGKNKVVSIKKSGIRLIASIK